jgi:hypothetical protein
VTLVDAVAELLPAFASAVDDTLAVLLIVVPDATEAFTATVIANEAEAPLATDALLAIIVPVLPTAGVVTVQPGDAVTATNVVFGGSASVSTTLDAALGPALATTIV